VLWLGFLTLIRVAVLIALASLVWVPVGVWIGLRPKVANALQPVAQFLAAFPANIVFPFAVVMIVRFGLDPNVWLSPLMILGTQWYILFNVIAGAQAIPSDLKEAAANYQLHSAPEILVPVHPGRFPYLVTGWVTAAGGAWNASIVAETVTFRGGTLTARGIGAVIARRRSTQVLANCRGPFSSWL